MQKVLSLLLAIVLLFSVSGCKAKKQELTLMSGQKKIKVVDIKNNVDENYAYVTGEDKNEYVFDLQSEKLTNNSAELARYSADKQNREIIVKNNMGSELFRINLSSLGYTGEQTNIEWSNIKKYLIIKDVKNKKSSLYDIDSKNLKDLPIDYVFTFIWNKDDTKVVLVNNSNQVKEAVLWDIVKKEVKKIEKTEFEKIKWTSDGENIYTIETRDSGGSNVKLFDRNSGIFKVAYTTLNKEIYGDIKWISDENIIFFSAQKVKGIYSYVNYFAVKASLTNDNIVEKQIDSDRPSAFIFSTDNKFIYYKDANGCFKSEIDFNEKK